MPSLIVRVTLLLIITATISLTVVAQRPSRPKPRATPLPETPTPNEPDNPAEPRNVDVLKTDTNLVSVPVIATDRSGVYIPDLAKEEFSISEDGVAQEIAFFAQVSAPFHAVGDN